MSEKKEKKNKKLKKIEIKFSIMKIRKLRMGKCEVLTAVEEENQNTD